MPAPTRTTVQIDARVPHDMARRIDAHAAALAEERGQRVPRSVAVRELLHYSLQTMERQRADRRSP